LVQRADLHETFEPGQRQKEKSPTWHRALMNKARSLGRPLPELLKEALEKEWGVKEINALGNVKPFVAWAGRCAVCSARTFVRMEPQFRGKGVSCPFCATSLGELS
jgi:hypothetical protein